MDFSKSSVPPPPAAGSAVGPAPAPGYYPDPEGHGGTRWWDGTQWTAHTTAPGAAPAPAAAGGPLLTSTESDARNWAAVAHVSPLVFGWFGALAFIGPLLVLALKGSSDPFVKQEATEALNFQLSSLLYLIVGGTITLILIFFLVGLLLIPVLIGAGIAWIALTVIATIRAGRGEAYRYPLTIRMVK